MREIDVKIKNMNLISYVLVIFLVSACTASMKPFLADWTAPNKFTEKQVYSAVLQAGSSIGYQPVMSDRESGAASFRRSLGATALGGEGILTLAVNVSTVGSAVVVRTTVTYNDFAVAGIHEEEIDKFYNALFNQLGISAQNQRQYNISVG